MQASVIESGMTVILPFSTTPKRAWHVETVDKVNHLAKLSNPNAQFDIELSVSDIAQAR